MRVAFCGKGGSGKTTLASLFIRFLAEKGEDVLAIDGDINQHLGPALGFSDLELAALPRLGQDQKPLKHYVAGTNKRIADPGHIIESTPAGQGSGFISRAGDDPVSRTFIARKGTLRFLQVGGHVEEDVGTTCFHKFTGAEGIFLNHYLDVQDEYVVGDMCAGADPFASSGLASRYDACVVVMEPTMKSVTVFQQARDYGAPYNIRLLPVANKIMQPSDLAFIEEQIGQRCLCSFAPLDAVRAAEQGKNFVVQDLDAAAISALALIKAQLDALPARDWQHYQAVGRAFHARAADGWASAAYGVDLNEQYDPAFEYPVSIAQAKAA